MGSKGGTVVVGDSSDCDTRTFWKGHGVFNIPTSFMKNF